MRPIEIMNWRIFGFLILALSTSGFATGDNATSPLNLTGLDARERSIRYSAHVFVPANANIDLIHATLARAARSLIGPLRQAKIAPSHREPMDGVTEQSRELLSMVDPDHPVAPAQQILRIGFSFEDRVAASLDLTARDNLDLPLLMSGEDSRELAEQCSEDPFVEPAYFWYYFKPGLPGCTQRIGEENTRVAAAENKLKALGFAGNFVSTAEVSRQFQTVNVQLGPEILPERSYYPEYDQLFGLDSSKPKLVVYLFAGVDLMTAYFGDRFLMEYFQTMRELFRSHPDLQGWAPGKDPSLLEFSILGESVKAGTYEELFTWIVDNRGFPPSLASNPEKIKELRNQARNRFVNRWVYWHFPIEVDDTRGKSFPMDLEIRSFYGDDNGNPRVEEAARQRYREAFGNADVFIYNGHSHLGEGALDPTRYAKTDFTDRYQLMFINSCSSFSYFGEGFMKLKAGGPKSLEVVLNALKSGIAHSGSVVTRFIEGILSTQSYSKMLASMHEAGGNEFDEMRLVDGEQDNRFDPRITPVVVHTRH